MQGTVSGTTLQGIEVEESRFEDSGTTYQFLSISIRRVK